MAASKILVVEDDRDILKLLKYNLEKEGHKVLTAADGEEGLALYRREKPSLLVLDLMLPKVDGLEICRLIRAQDKKTPLLMLTAKGAEVDKIVGLEMGADDYVSKPFSLREVMTRVKALLRRAAPEETSLARRSAGVLEADFDRYEVLLARKPVSLTTKEFELLKVLWLSGGKVLNREEILEKVWGYEKSADIDTRTVDQHVARLRGKLGPEKKRLRTIKNIGYRFTAAGE